MFKGLHFHSHPDMERAHRIPSDHVIIDRGAYDELRELIEKERKSDFAYNEIKEALIKCPGVIIHYPPEVVGPESVLKYYPNKFEIITNENQATKPGLYYINSELTNDLKDSLTLWINDLIKEKRDLMRDCASTIMESEFCKKYNYPIGKFMKKQGVYKNLRDYYTGLRLNSIRIDTFLDSEARLMLWGSYVKGLKQENLLSVKLAHEYPTLEHMAVIMSLLNTIINANDQYMYDHINALKYMGYIYNGCLDSDVLNLLIVQMNRVENPYKIDLRDKENLKKDFEILKSYFIKEE